MTFDLKKAAIYKAVTFYKIFPSKLLKFYRILFFTLTLIPFVFWAIDNVYKLNFSISIAWFYIFFPLGFSVLFFELFGEYYLKHPKTQGTNNLADFLDYDSARVFNRALFISRSIGESELSVKSILIAFMEDDFMGRIFIRLVPEFLSLKAEMRKTLNFDQNFLRTLSLFSQNKVSSQVIQLVTDALDLKDRHGSERISVLDIMAAMFDQSDEFKRFVLSHNLDRKDIEELGKWYEHIWAFRDNLKKFWSLDNLLRQPPVGRDWIYGYSRHLTAFAVNLTDKLIFSSPVLRLVTRKKEIDQMEQILARAGENNVLLVGEEGVGKERIINDFAELITKGQALPQLNYKKVLDLNLSLVAGSSKDIADVQNILISIFNEASRAGNIILVLKDFHNFIGEIGGLGRIDVSEVVVPYLKSSSIQVIATTNPASFHRFIERRSELTDVFERINILEPDTTQTLEILEEAIPALESHSGVTVTYGGIKEVVTGADKFIRTSPFPEKAFDLLSEVIAYAVAQKKHLINEQDVNEVISRKTGVPLGSIGGEEKEKLTKLEELMHQELIGQERAVEVVSSTMRRLRTGLAKRGKPAGVFLFVGPTGVGKTLTAKILAKTYFGSADRMVRFDMSEYQNQDSLDRFIGSTRTEEPGQFVSVVRDNPFSLILLDEIEKADRNILNIFLQVFDEGYLTDVFGRKVNFEQNIIIATSNAGADFIRELVKQGLDPSLEKERVIDILIQGRSFTPELLNRFDEIVIFHALSQEQIYEIAKILMKGLVKRLEEKGYLFKPTDDVIEYVSGIGFDPQFGARPMERVIRDRVENKIAEKILDGSIQKGREFVLSVDDIK